MTRPRAGGNNSPALTGRGVDELFTSPALRAGGWSNSPASPGDYMKEGRGDPPLVLL